MLKEKIVVSLGGNAIVRRGGSGTIEEQFANAGAACACVARIASGGSSVIITHGNGPIVGNLVIQNESAKNTVPPMPLYICDADSEGAIGFVIQQTLYNRLHKIHRIKEVVAVVTQVVVNPKDAAFGDPSKPVGPFYSKEEAEILSVSKGWAMKEDSFRGYRRVVPSPRPMRIVEAGVIGRLAEEGVVVIAAGGGGVPVVEDGEGMLSGIDAVVDKDLSTAILAVETKAKLIINLTQTDMVYLNFGKPGERGIPDMGIDEARRYLAEGHFAPGSMRPKIEGAVEFLENGGDEVIITTPELVEEALGGRAGTRIRA
ncbi:MAG: carbamate kinase [Deltaproteobacteria bacterium]|nr:carbamate kinase [Deltaproteobacteria bacterium]